MIRGFILPTGHDEFTDPKVDCDAFCKGILAILWRASLTSHPAYSDVLLGPYEAIVRDILFGLRSLADIGELEIVIQHYRSGHLGDNVNLFYTIPVLSKFGDLNGFGFALNGFRIAAKIDKRPFPRSFHPYIINRTGMFRGMMVELERTPEFSRMADMAIADIIRRGVTSRPA